TFLNTDDITANHWHHVALVLDGTDTLEADVLTGYLDGEQFGSGAGSQLWKRGNDIGIGGINGATKFHDGDYSVEDETIRNVLGGSIDDVRVYNQALSAAEIDTLSNYSQGMTHIDDYSSNSLNPLDFGLDPLNTQVMPGSAGDPLLGF
ncbi:MAG: LamG-like jellyroll fold domain-containing protein, partial [Microcystaceae cyanobacterium]